MRLLQLTHRLPWPPIDGGKKGTLGFVDGYRRHAGIDHHGLLSMCPREEADWAADWKPEGTDLKVDLMDARNSAVRVLANTAFSSQPFNMAKYQRPSFEAMVREAINARRPDVVHFDSLHTAWYAARVRQEAPDALRVLRCHNAEHVILARLAESETNPVKKALIALQAKRLHDYEAAALDAFDLILAITEADAARFRAMNPRIDPRMIIVPAGADVPDVLPPSPAAVGGPIRLVHIAAMDWLPNQAALKWFLEGVLPGLDEAGLDYRLDVVGKNMPDDFKRYESARVRVHGFVQDLAPITSAAHVAVVPLQVGGGMRVKILDYWAMGIPVIATQVGAEGLSDGVEATVALADTQPDFVRAILQLARSPESREALRASAFRKVRANYGWAGIVDGLVSRYGDMLSRRAGTRA